MALDGIGKGDAFSYLNSINSTGKTDKSVKSTEISTNKPIELVSTESVGRQDLDNLSPYAALGVKFSKAAPGTVEDLAQAAPEFGRWTGNFALKDPKAAADRLGFYDPVGVENSLKSNGFLDVLDAMDSLVS